MAGDTSNPRVWANADVFTAPLGTTAPTDIATVFSGAWDDLGLMSEDGFTEAQSDTQDDKYAYGGILVRTTRSKHKRTMKVIALEDNPIVFALVNPGSDVSTTSAITTRNVKVPVTDRRAFALELRDGNITKRRIIPSGEILAIGDIAISDSQMVAYEMTITIYPDADSVLYIDITDDPQAAV